MEPKRISNISNYYGGLWLKKEDIFWYWSIENYDGHYWHAIPDYLGEALFRFQEEIDAELHRERVSQD